MLNQVGQTFKGIDEASTVKLKMGEGEDSVEGSTECLEDTPNLWFYEDQLSPFGGTLTQFLQMSKNNFTWDSDIGNSIQWLFPNYYQSDFNFNSTLLSATEARYFRTVPRLGSRLLCSFLRFIRLFGMKMMLDYQEQRVSFHVTQPKRYSKLIHQCYYCMQILRVVASLSVTGFRAIAVDFAQFALQEPAIPFLVAERLMGYLHHGEQYCRADRYELLQQNVLGWEQVSKIVLIEQ